MTAETAAPAATPEAPALAERVRDLASLTKPGIVLLTVAMAAAGAALAPGTLGPSALAGALGGTGLLVAAANVLNQYLERDTDARMIRTASRPLPARRLPPWAALVLGATLGVAGAATLGALTNLLTLALGLLACGSYLAVYTPLKRRTALALLVGAVPGAMPPLMGWTARAGAPGLPGLALFGIVFLWQLPHFLAIAAYLKDDYARAGIRALPVAHGDRLAHRVAVAAALALLGWSLLLTPLGITGWRCFGAALVLGLVFAGFAAAGLRPGAGRAGARRLFLVSLVYLPVLTAVLVLDASAP